MTIVVQPVPAGHPYVAALRGPGIGHLADPAVPGAPPGQWWPPQALRADWIAANAHRFDLLHVHFGTEGLAVDDLAAAVEALARADRPLVHTVHDIEHPHLGDADAFAPQLEVLVRGATSLITLTPGAAAELRRRFDVHAQVIPHPSLAPERWFAEADRIRAARRAAGGGPVVGLHLRAMRANVRPGAWLVPLAEATAQAGGAFQVFVNDEPFSDEATAAWETVQAALGGVDGVQIQRRPRPDDDALAHELASLDLSVLPYRHGSHSGWVELCWDLGVPVAAPPVGFVREQHDDPWFLGPPLEAGHAAEIVEHAARSTPPPAAERLVYRRRQLDAARRDHAAVYREALSPG